MTINIGGDEVTEITMDGDAVTEVTADGDVVWTASAPTQVIDGFEDADPLSNYVGSTGDYSIVTSPTESGSGALFASSFSAEIGSDTGLDNYPTRGDEFEFYMRHGTVDQTYALSGALAAVQDAQNPLSNAYAFEWLFQTDDYRLRIRERDGGSSATSEITPWTFTPQADTWYRNVVDFDSGGNGDITLTVHDANSADTTTLTLSSTLYDSGGFGWYCDTNHDAYYDSAVISSGGNGGGTGPTVVDSYERASLDHYNNPSGDYSISSAFATDGSNGVEFTGQADSRQNAISTSGLDNYAPKGSEIQVDIETSNGSSVSSTHEFSPLFGVVDTDNFYMAQILVDEPSVRLWHYQSGFNTITASQSLSEWNADTTYRMRIQWDDGSTFGGSDGDITVDVFNPSDTNIGGVSANDTTHDGTGIGFSSIIPTTSDYNRADYWRITN